MIESRCGICCSWCDYREAVNCMGCNSMANPFWGACAVKACCEEKKLEHCGSCEAFPCVILTSFAYDEKQGDNGTRIKQCRKWKKGI